MGAPKEIEVFRAAYFLFFSGDRAAPMTAAVPGNRVKKGDASQCILLCRRESKVYCVGAPLYNMSLIGTGLEVVAELLNEKDNDAEGLVTTHVRQGWDEMTRWFGSGCNFGGARSPRPFLSAQEDRSVAQRLVFFLL